MPTDAERLDWLEKEAEGCALLSDDFGNWAVSTMGMQNIPDPVPEKGTPGDIGTSHFVKADEWKPSIRDAIDAAMAEYG